MALCKWCGNEATRLVKHRYSPEEQGELAAYRDSFKEGFHTGHLRVGLLVLPGTMIDLCDECCLKDGQILPERLSTVRRIIEGLEMFEAAGDTEVAANHEVVMAGCPDNMTPEQKEALIELGWVEDPQLECFKIFVN